MKLVERVVNIWIEQVERIARRGMTEMAWDWWIAELEWRLSGVEDE